MAETTYRSKVVYFGQTLMDLTADTVTPDKLLVGETTHDKSGAPITGTMPNHGNKNKEITSKDDILPIEAGYYNGAGHAFISATEKAKLIPENINPDVTVLGVKGTYTNDATAADAEILAGETAYVAGKKVTGTMPNKGGSVLTLSGTGMIIPKGYYNGTGMVMVDPVSAGALKPENIKPGVAILGVNGSFTNDATAAASEILDGETAYIGGVKVEGTMPNNGSHGIQISDIQDAEDGISIPAGYHDGSGKAHISPEEVAKIIPGNIKLGVEILGVTGTCEPSSDVTVEPITVTPTKDGATYNPSETDYFSKVILNPIPYTEVANEAGGLTVTIG